MPDRDPDPYVLYTVMRRGLGIHGGKIGAQCQHAFDYLSRAAEEYTLTEVVHRRIDERMEPLMYGFRTWRNGPEHVKIVLGASDAEFERVKEEFPNDGAFKRHFLVIDLGFTQVAPNTETCLALWPMRKSARPPLLQKLRPL